MSDIYAVEIIATRLARKQYITILDMAFEPATPFDVLKFKLQPYSKFFIFNKENCTRDWKKMPMLVKPTIPWFLWNKIPSKDKMGMDRYSIILKQRNIRQNMHIVKEAKRFDQKHVHRNIKLLWGAARMTFTRDVCQMCNCFDRWLCG